MLLVSPNRFLVSINQDSPPREGRAFNTFKRRSSSLKRQNWMDKLVVRKRPWVVSRPRSEIHGRRDVCGSAPSIPRRMLLVPTTSQLCRCVFQKRRLISLSLLLSSTLPTIRDKQPRFSSSTNTKFNPIQPNRPTPSSMSSMVESFSGPKVVSNPVSRVKIVNPVAPDDCRSDCDSSSTVVDDDNNDYCVLTSLFRKIQPFDLNLPPSMNEDFGIVDDLQATALCL